MGDCLIISSQINILQVPNRGNPVFQLSAWTIFYRRKNLAEIF